MMDANQFNIIFIKAKQKRLLELLNSPEVTGNITLQDNIRYFIQRTDQLIKTISENSTFEEGIYNSNFFIAKSSVNRFFRDWNLEEVADVYNEIQKIAEKYLSNNNNSI